MSLNCFVKVRGPKEIGHSYLCISFLRSRFSVPKLETLLWIKCVNFMHCFKMLGLIRGAFISQHLSSVYLTEFKFRIFTFKCNVFQCNSV